MASLSVDALVVGSGFGGSFAAHALAKAGLRTLLLERGDWPKRDDEDWNPREIMLQQRYRSDSPIRVRQHNDRVFRTQYPNETVGGMSVFYGGASFRLRERDFSGWPICYGDLEPYYGQAERLLEVHGHAGEDPCEPRRSEGYPYPPIPLTPPAQRIHSAARRLGYRPFAMPLAINFGGGSSRPSCVKCDTCDGFPCKIGAKNDLAATVLRAAQVHGLRIMTGCVVARLRKGKDKNRIAGAECIDQQSRQSFSVEAGVVVLSGGALSSPVILMRSRLADGEGGRFVGRFLMRHCSAVVTGIFPFKTNPDKVFHKQLCLTDFYEDHREQYGTATGIVQDVYAPEPEVVAHFAPLLIKPFARLTASRMQNLLCLAEDEPNYANLVSLADERDGLGLELPQVEHCYSRADYLRRDYLVARARKVLRAAGAPVAAAFYSIDSFSHAVGTVRFGQTPATGALDPNCRLWGIQNLYVLDGSFMPTSAGINPSLTIAANAARVADVIVSGAVR